MIGDAGLIYPEGDVRALAATLQQLAEQPALYADLARRGRARVLERYTQAARRKGMARDGIGFLMRKETNNERNFPTSDTDDFPTD